MQVKDYYTILELEPSASVDEIKKSYRRLAQLYHPDKNNDDLYASTRFSAIKEAYETLTNPMRRNQYLQQRWYAKSIGQKQRTEIATPENLLKELLQLEKYTRTLDQHRMDQQGLYDYLAELLSDDSIKMLNLFGEQDINKEIAGTSLRIIQPINYSYLLEIAKRLKKISWLDKSITAKTDKLIKERLQFQYWEKRRVWIILTITLLLCLLIFLSARK